MSSRGDRALRADLKPYKRRRARTWGIRGWVPIRQADGTISRRRIERSAKTSSKAEARAEAERWATYYEGRALAIRRPLTFHRAAHNYMAAGGDPSDLTDALFDRIGVMQCADIDDTIMTDLAAELFPGRTVKDADGTEKHVPAAPSYVNRHLYTPILAVLNMARRGQHCPKPAFTRPRGYGKRPPIKPPPESWFVKILPWCSRKLQALIIIMTLHGLRIAEAIERRPADLDAERGILWVPTTKGGKPAEIELAEPALAAILMIPDWAEQRWLFGTHNRRNITRDLRKACARAGLDYYAPHTLGRHAFASRLLRMGYSLKFVQEAGRWESIRIVADTYGHLEQSHVTADVRKVGQMWGRGLEPKPGAQIIPLKNQSRKRKP